MKYMDKLFNVGSSTDSVDSAVNYAQYFEELNELKDASLKMAAKFQNPGTVDISEK